MTKSRFNKKPLKYYKKRLKHEKYFDPFHLIDDMTFLLNIKAMGFYKGGLCAIKKKSKDKP